MDDVQAGHASHGLHCPIFGWHSAACVRKQTCPEFGNCETAGTAHMHQICLHCLGAGAGEHVADSPYSLLVLPGAASPKHSVVIGPACRTATAGTASAFSVEARDVHHNRCCMAESCLSAMLAMFLGKCAMYQSAFGLCQPHWGCNHWASLSGSWSIGKQCEPAHADSISCCVLSRCDRADLAVELPLVVQLKGAAGEVAVEVVPGLDGCYACSYTGPAAGFYRLEVTSDGKHVSGSPFSVQVRSDSVLLQALECS